MSDEKVDVGDVITFWAKHKNKIWGGILLAVGLLGGNVDRVGSLIPDVANPGLVKRVESLENSVKSFNTVFSENKFCTCSDKTPKGDDGVIKVE